VVYLKKDLTNNTQEVAVKKKLAILSAVLALFVLASCGQSVVVPTNTISPADLTDDQQDIVELLSIPSQNEILLFDFDIDDSYRSIEVWVELYENGEQSDRMAMLHTVGHDTVNISGKGRLAIMIRHDPELNWTLFLSYDGSRSSYSTSEGYEIDLDPGWGRASGPMSGSAAIEDGKEIVLYSSVYNEGGLAAYDAQYYQEHPEVLGGYAFAHLIKARFSK
jgi:hypothetical protein